MKIADKSALPTEAVYAEVKKKSKTSPSSNDGTELVENDQYVTGPQKMSDDTETELVDNSVYDSAPSKQPEKMTPSDTYAEIAPPKSRGKKQGKEVKAKKPLPTGW